MKSSLRMRSRRQGAGSEAEASEKTGYTITKKGGRFADMSFLRIEDRPVQVSQSENMESSGNRKETIISCVPNFFSQVSMFRAMEDRLEAVVKLM